MVTVSRKSEMFQLLACASAASEKRRTAALRRRRKHPLLLAKFTLAEIGHQSFFEIVRSAPSAISAVKCFAGISRSELDLNVFALGFWSLEELLLRKSEHARENVGREALDAG